MLAILLSLLVAPLIALLIWHVISILLSVEVRSRRPCQPSSRSPAGKVALLYLTCDDFNPSACSSLLGQEGPECDLFILDDSTRTSVRKRIDDWVCGRNEAVRVVRRLGRSAYKGGNVNHWLDQVKGLAAQYRWALLADADEHLPRDFTHRLLGYLESGDHAFAQGCHLGTAELHTLFQALLHPEVECEWLYHVPARNLGIPPMLGHGVLLRLESMMVVGGFPDLVSEDLALTILLARKGLTGIVAPDIVACEEFPRSYRAYWTRKRRWIQADAEIVRKMLGKLWQIPAGLLPRLDFAVRELRLLVMSAQWMLASTMAAVAIFGHEADVLLPPSAWLLLPCALIPALPALAIARLTPTRRILYVATQAFVGAATSSLHPIASVHGLLGKQHFEPTGGAPGHMRSGDSLPWSVWEAFSALLFIIGGFVGANLALVSVGFAVGCSPWMRTRWEGEVLVGGTMIFWWLMLTQVYVDLKNGSVPIDHIVVFLGLL